MSRLLCLTMLGSPVVIGTEVCYLTEVSDERCVAVGKALEIQRTHAMVAVAPAAITSKIYYFINYKLKNKYDHTDVSV